MVVGGEVEEPPLAVNKRTPPHNRLISVFELLGAYIGVRLWTPYRICNNDLLWLEVPVVTENLGVLHS